MKMESVEVMVIDLVFHELYVVSCCFCFLFHGCVWLSVTPLKMFLLLLFVVLIYSLSRQQLLKNVHNKRLARPTVMMEKTRYRCITFECSNAIFSRWLSC